jgi:DNA replication protein DnaC
MKSAALSFALDMITGRTPPYWLSLLGTSGAGKTMLAKIVSRLFRCNKKGAIVSETPSRIWYASGGFIKWATLVQWIREGDWRAFNDVSDDWFVCVDDIGAEHATDLSRSKLYEMFDRGESKWRIWTGNLSLAQIDQRIDPRISSRMLRNSGVVVDVDVPDFNLRTKP